MRYALLAAVMLSGCLEGGDGAIVRSMTWVLQNDRAEAVPYTLKFGDAPLTGEAPAGELHVEAIECIEGEPVTLDLLGLAHADGAKDCGRGCRVCGTGNVSVRILPGGR